MKPILDFSVWVPGVPVPQGSMRSPRAGVVLHNSPKLMSWRDAIGWAAKEEWRGRPLIDEPVKLTAVFYFPPPKRPRDPVFSDTKPDLDKLIRAAGDGLQGVVLKDDSRIAVVTAVKRWVGAGVFARRDEAGAWLSLDYAT